jgi:Fur family ferric uptake transcriptional regulator
MDLAWTESALAQMRSTSGRSGGARRAVVELLAGEDCCLSAQEIHDRLRAGGERVGIASVYRTLDGLDALGLVQRVDLGDGVSRFERADPRGDHHHHLVCGKCGKVEAFSDARLESVIDNVSGATSFRIDDHDVVLRGRCESCA